MSGAARLLIRVAPQARVTEAPKLIRSRGEEGGSSSLPSLRLPRIAREASIFKFSRRSLETLAEQADHQLSSRGRAQELTAAEGQLQHRARLSAGGRRGMPAGGAKQPGQRASLGGRVNSSGQCPGARPAIRESR